MSKLLGMLGATVGGYVGWWIGAHVGVMTGFFVSVVGSGAGMYGAVRIARQYLD
jgi:hypothetical protein